MNKYVIHYDTVCSVCKEREGTHCKRFYCEVIDALENCVGEHTHILTKQKSKGIGSRYSATMFAQDDICEKAYRNNDEWRIVNAKKTFLAVCAAKKIIRDR